MRFDAGSQFAGYTVVSRLGRGGMATVYLVREPGLNRLVALKVLPQQLSDDDRFAPRFEQEAQVIAALDHPNIIPLYRYGIDEDVPWMALRYVDGGDLAARLAGRPLATSEGLPILRGVAAALDYAHRKGVIHRDLKPQNILLTGDGSPYLADFGVAKLLEGSGRLKTATGSIFGTPAYMAPEQAMANPLGPYTDVYALAVICFQWLTGKLPFDADTPHAILLKHVQEPLPPTAMGLLPTGVASVIDRGLAKDPQQRFQSAGAFASDLESALQLISTAPAAAIALRRTNANSKGNKSNVADRAPERGAEAPSSAKRESTAKRVLRWIVTALFGAVVIGAGVFYWPQIHGMNPDAISDQKSKEGAIEAQGAIEALLGRLDSTERAMDSHVRDARSSVEKLDGMVRMARTKDENEDLAHQLADAKSRLDLATEVQDVAKSRVFESNAMIDVKAKKKLGDTMLQDGHIQEAAKALDEAKTSLQSMAASTDEIERSLVARNEAIDAVKRFSDIAKSEGDQAEESLIATNSLMSAGMQALQSGDFDKAHDEYAQAMVSIRGAALKYFDARATYYKKLAAAKMDVGNLSAAEEALNHAKRLEKYKADWQ